jgi:uncharacterized protein with von Willebrand factor type A (vWA) domain
MVRGAVVLIISDGWETGDPELLGRHMTRLSRVTYRIVWANPRTQSPRYRREFGGMARLAVLRRRGQRAQPGRPGRPARRAQLN